MNTQNGVPGDNEWTGCHLDWCFTPAPTPAITTTTTTTTITTTITYSIVKYYSKGRVKVTNTCQYLSKEKVSSPALCQQAAAVLGKFWKGEKGSCSVPHGCVQ